MRTFQYKTFTSFQTCAVQFDYLSSTYYKLADYFSKKFLKRRGKSVKLSRKQSIVNTGSRRFAVPSFHWKQWQREIGNPLLRHAKNAR